MGNEYSAAHLPTQGTLGRADSIPLPSITSDGKYFAPELRSFLQRCGARNVPLHAVASRLNVPKHRVIYLMSSEGQRLILGEVDA